MAEQRFRHSHTRPRAPGPEYLTVPTRNPLLDKNDFYSEDDEYSRSLPVATSMNPRVRAPLVNIRRRTRSFGDAAEPSAPIPNREHDYEREAGESIRSSEF